jgi:hypothetical protein
VGLRVPIVLVPPHGDQRVALELLAQKRNDRRDREGVPVDKDDHLVVLGRVGDQVAEKRQLQLMLVNRDVGGIEELVGVSAELRIDPGIDSVRLVEVALEVAPLDVDPASRAPVHRCYVDHGTERSRNGSSPRDGGVARTGPRRRGRSGARLNPMSPGGGVAT